DVGKSDALPNLISFYKSILNQGKRPSYGWKVEGDQIKITFDAANKPAAIKLWSAYNPLARDFRIDVFGPNWTSEDIAVPDTGELTVNLITPESGYRGYFVELTYGGDHPLKVTSGIDILPRTYPFEPFQPRKTQ
uniref:PhoPQ-activated protein PqaA family protein n=1 Tax=Algoriphagus sp. TaxID=1872435 RepID=UPI002583BA9E